LKAQLLSGELTLPSSEIWVIGGAEIYEALKGVLDRIYLTRLNLAFKGDAFLSNIEADMRLIAAESFPDGVFEVYAI
jgi:dihydrofolate reductase